NLSASLQSAASALQTRSLPEALQTKLKSVLAEIELYVDTATSRTVIAPDDPPRSLAVRSTMTLPPLPSAEAPVTQDTATLKRSPGWTGAREGFGPPFKAPELRSYVRPSGPQVLCTPGDGAGAYIPVMQPLDSRVNCRPREPLRVGSPMELVEIPREFTVPFRQALRPLDPPRPANVQGSGEAFKTLRPLDSPRGPVEASRGTPSPLEQPTPLSPPPATPRDPAPIAALVGLEGYKDAKIGRPAPAGGQDRGFIIEVCPVLTVFGIFDGHGANGHHVAELVSTTFQREVDRCWPSREASLDYENLQPRRILSWIKHTFKTADETLARSTINAEFSGCTASVAVRHKRDVFVGYVGDSKTVSLHFRGTKARRVIETPDHNPASPLERERIEAAGSSVQETFFDHLRKPVSRIQHAGLCVSRSFGDMHARQFGVISEPEFVQFSPEAPKSEDTAFGVMLVLASDGLWDTLEPQEVPRFVSNRRQTKDELVEDVKVMTETAWRRRLTAEGRSDDTTVIVALIS
ncbi:MAG: hypothetical protein KVP17_002455, partial [Porospora cf. gigantea B]|uniref:uncharacterized protein n=1 Tax=Porospora cf. gigantea B TaxID=2853592 RepID=UPI003571EFE2